MNKNTVSKNISKFAFNGRKPCHMLEVSEFGLKKEKISSNLSKFKYFFTQFA